MEKTHQATRSFRAKVDTDIGNFNISQKPEDRREFDLNNPKRLWIDLPGRINDSDPRCGASSLQKFSGEDLQREERLRDQKMQMKVWTALAKQDAINRRLQQQHEKE